MPKPYEKCCECARIFNGTRTEARRAFWEPYSTRSQFALDSGPIVCPDCVGQVIDGVMDAMQRFADA
jgi:hypothetical protein